LDQTCNAPFPPLAVWPTAGAMASLFGLTPMQDSLSTSQAPRRRHKDTSFVGLLGAPFGTEPSPCLGGKGSTFGTRDLELPGQVSCWIRQLVSTTAEKEGNASAAKKHRRAGVLAQATQLVSDFCECFPALHLEPTRESLEELLLSCSSLPRTAVAQAFQEQLSWASGDMEWQPRLRALFALEHFDGQGGHFGRAVVRKVVGEAQGILHHLEAEVPQCREKATRVLARARLSSQGKCSL